MATDDQARQAALDRINARRGFFANLASFVFVSVLMIGIWALSGRGPFWPIWVIGAYALGIAVHAWKVFGQRPVTEADIEKEMRRGGDTV